MALLHLGRTGVAPWQVLAVAGLASEVIYLVALANPFPLARLYNVPLMDLGKLTNYESGAFALFLLAAAALFAAYGLAARACSGSGRPPGTSLVLLALGFPAVFHFILIFAYPVGAADLFDYVANGRLMALYDRNPLVVPVTEIAQDPSVALAAWPYRTLPYGPLWALLNGGLTRLTGEILPNLFGLKLLAGAAWLATMLLVYGLLRQWEPERALAGAVVVGWNPLAVYEVAVNGHNDALLGPALVVAVAMAAGARPALALVPLVVGALLKFAPLMLVPLVAIEVWRRRAWRGLIPAVVLSAVVVVAAYAPFWEGEATFEILRRQAGLLTTSPAMVLRLALEGAFGLEVASQVARWATMALFLGLAGALGRKAVRGECAFTLAASLLLAAYLGLVAWWFQPWYLLWLLPVAALTPVALVRRLVVLWSCTAGLTYAVFVYVWVMNADRLTYSDVQWIATTVLYLPLILYAAWSWRRMRRRWGLGRPRGAAPTAYNESAEA